MKILDAIDKPEVTERRGRSELYTEAYLALMDTPVGKWRPFECTDSYELSCLASAIRQRAKKVGASICTRSEGKKLYVKRIG